LADAVECYKIVPFGVDVSLRAVQIARARGFLAHHGSIEEAPSEFAEFKVVTAIDVIEHVVDPELLLRHVRERLAAGGVLYLQTANVDASVYQVGWRIGRITGARPRNMFARLFPPQHLQYFSQLGLASLARKCRFEVRRMETKAFPVNDIIGERVLFTLVTGAQFLDSLTRKRILIRALLQKPK
jgi:2-polyprenyl-3-methyl-5-hydroxy-6-metoxy-1,4-benzoquinol methylase